jgi:hypothetical protein
MFKNAHDQLSRSDECHAFHKIICIFIIYQELNYLFIYLQIITLS